MKDFSDADEQLLVMSLFLNQMDISLEIWHTESTGFIFFIYTVGFLPKHARSRRERLIVSANEAATQIFYVPPHKLHQFLEETSSFFTDSR